MPRGRRWTPDEIRVLQASSESKDWKRIGVQLNRSETAVRVKAASLEKAGLAIQRRRDQRKRYSNSDSAGSSRGESEYESEVEEIQMNPPRRRKVPIARARRSRPTPSDPPPEAASVVPAPVVPRPPPETRSLDSFYPKYLVEAKRVDAYEQMFAWPLICAVANDSRDARATGAPPLTDAEKAATAARLLMATDNEWTASDAATEWARLAHSPCLSWGKVVQQWAEHGRDPIAAETFPQGAAWVYQQMTDN
jgi:hypothetical protein